MKKIIFLLFWVTGANFVFAQNPFGATQSPVTLPLYISKQTGEFTFIEGTYSKIADEFEDGNCGLSKTGPVVYSISPAPSYGPNSSTSWTGSIKPDIANCPEPGTSSPATLSGDYDIHFSKPGAHAGVQRSCDAYYVGSDGTVHDPHGCGGIHTVVNVTGTGVMNYEVISIKIELAKEFARDLSDSINFQYQLLYPGGGTVEWTTPYGNFTGASQKFKFDPAHINKQVIAKYTIEGVSYSDTATIAGHSIVLTDGKCLNGKVVVNAICVPPYDSTTSQIAWTFPNNLTCEHLQCTGEYNPLLAQQVQAVYILNGVPSAPASINLTTTAPTVGLRYSCASGMVNASVTCDPPFNSAYGSLTWQIPSSVVCNTENCTFPLNNALPQEQQLIKVTYNDGCGSAQANEIIKYAKLTDFKLPGCIDGKKAVKDIAKLTFDGDCKPKVIFNPDTVGFKMGVLASVEGEEVGDGVKAEMDIPDNLPLKKFNATATANGITLNASTLGVDSEFEAEIDNEIKDKIKSILEKIKEVETKFAQLTGTVAPPEVPFPPKPEFKFEKPEFGYNISVMGHLNCCEEGTTYLVKMSGKVAAVVTAKMSGEFKIYIPIPFVPPPVAVAIIMGELGVEGKIGGAFMWDCPPPYKGCLVGEFKIEASLGLGLQFGTGLVEVTANAGGDLLSMEAQVCAHIPPPGVEAWGKVYSGPVAISGKVCGLWGLICKTFANKQLWDKTLILQFGDDPSDN